MKLLTKAIEKKLEKAGYYGETAICKFFNPCGDQTWIITGRDPEESDILYGVADLGMGCVEAGSMSLSEFKSIRLPFGLGIERDLNFKGGQPISELVVRENLRGL